MSDVIERAKRFLMGRQTAYRVVFDGPKAEEVLVDLAKFCRADQTTFHPDPRIEGRLDGRREVWLRIQHHLQLTPDELWKLYQSK
jgi:hypothetical protein